MPRESGKHIFSADRPIYTQSQDKLNRAMFSKELASTICNWSEKDSLVVAIYGEWGDGKTSVKNLIKETFDLQSKDITPMTLEFNPWQWSGESGIVDAFFREIAQKLGSTTDDDQKKIAKKFREYSEYLDIGNELATKLKSTLERALFLFSGGSFILTAAVDDEFKGKIALFSTIIFFFALFIGELNWLLKLIARKVSIGADGKSLEEKKSELIQLLSGMNKTLVIFLDDIDRLNKDEIKSLFKVVKANADFPNIVYLAFFQRDIVEKSLDEGDVYQGKDYLKKIVQVGFDLPKVMATDIHSVLFDELNALLADKETGDRFEKSRWAELFAEGGSHFFKNLRDVNRFISTFKFHFGVMRHKSASEVNFVDLVGIEIIRQFEHEAYQEIFLSKKLLTTSSGSSSVYPKTSVTSREFLYHFSS